jgi:hypothetical protein
MDQSPAGEFLRENLKLDLVAVRAAWLGAERLLGRGEHRQRRVPYLNPGMTAQPA